MTSKYYPPYGGTGSTNVKVQLDLTNYATKDNVKNITHVDVSSFASKTNLATLKSELDKLDTDKLKTVPADLAKLTNVADNDVIKKTVYYPKITAIESDILKNKQGKDNNLAEINKLKAIDSTQFVTKTKFTTDVNSLDDKIDKVDKKIPDVSGLVTKTSVDDAAKKLTTEFGNKILGVENKLTDLSPYAKKDDVASDIGAIKNGYVTTASLTAQLNDLKSQHIASEVKTIDDKTKKNASDILAFEARLKQKEDVIDDVQRDNALTNGRDYYRDGMYLLYECRVFSFKYTGDKIDLWKSKGLNNYARNSDMDAVTASNNDLPSLVDNGRMSVKFGGCYFKQTKLIRPNNNNVTNLYIVYMLDSVTAFRSDTYTVQNALFGGVKITKNATDTSKHKYEGYGICFDEGGLFSMGDISDGRNVFIFGVQENSLVHTGNKNNNIYVMGDGFVQGINDTTLYAEKTYATNFSAVNKKFVLSLHYNGDNSYLFVNGKQELKFKAKDDQIVKEIMCLGNISDDWTVANAEHTGLHGTVYDFAVDYTKTNIGDIYNIHRYLMKKNGVI